MRRIGPALLAFFGVACITAAIAIPAWLVPQLRVVPLDLDIVSVSTTVPADNATGNRFPAVIFDRCSVSENRARTLEAHLTQQRRSVIIEPSDRREATVQSAQSVLIDRVRDADGNETAPTVAPAGDERQCSDGLLTASIDRVSLNRKTSVPNGTVSMLQLEAAPEGVDPKTVSVDLGKRQGFQYKFGFDVQKREYYYYDLNTRQDAPAKFVDEKVINGVKTYHFVSEVPEKDLSELPNVQGNAALGTMLTMPARWWGITGRGIRPNTPIEMHRYATATRHVWVEPETGTIIDGREDQHQYFRSPDQSDATAQPVRDFRMDALKATFQWDDATIANQADKANHYKNLLKLGGFWLPLILGILGVVLLAAWAFLFWRGRRRDDTRPDDGDGFDGRGPDDDGPDGPTRVIPRDTDDRPGAGAAAGAGAATAVIDRDRPADPDATAPSETARPAGLNPWERPTEQIPKVSGPRHAESGADDFGPVHRDTPASDAPADDTATRNWERPAE
ncbi:DUF3068 domain-containing protein [Gordonia bronchialis]|uniref:DUF3068 domain-containing protein n=1 Tax=Gordonia bronchialis TaxID=2054 RepID=UPI001CBB8F62|nr:DUF3068 domain-containing protein [Gordonia bronchialis]UAK36725.1 DUF3068 domain-containing protein [Gordonia bronchialis]